MINISLQIDLKTIELENQKKKLEEDLKENLERRKRKEREEFISIKRMNESGMNYTFEKNVLSSRNNPGDLRGCNENSKSLKYETEILQKDT